MPGLRFKLWPIFGVKKFPWVQVPAGEIGVVIAQVGAPLPIGAKSARRTSPSSANFSDLAHVRRATAAQKGVQRPVLPPGTLLPIHPVAFLVITAGRRSTACRCRPSSAAARRDGGGSRPESFGLSPEQLQVVVIAPDGPQRHGRHRHRARGRAAAVGRHRQPARRLRRHRRDGGRRRRSPTPRSSSCCSAARTTLHNNYQDFQAFLDAGGKHRPAARPAALRRVPAEPVPRARRAGADARREPGRGRGDQGASSACRRSTRRARSSSSARSCVPGTAASGRSRCAPASTRSTRACYAAEIVPTFILTLNWADAVSQAHDLDAHLSPIVGKSREGFVFQIDLQVQIHVPDTQGAEGDLDGRHDAATSSTRCCSRRSATTSATRCRRSRRCGSSRPASEVQAAAFEAITRVPRAVRGRDAGRLHPGRRVPRRSSSRC